MNICSLPSTENAKQNRNPCPSFCSSVDRRFNKAFGKLIKNYVCCYIKMKVIRSKDKLNILCYIKLKVLCSKEKSNMLLYKNESDTFE